jgi:hypothetical protein
MALTLASRARVGFATGQSQLLSRADANFVARRAARFACQLRAPSGRSERAGAGEGGDRSG